MQSGRSEVRVPHRPPLTIAVSYSVYILRSERNGRYYTGYSADPIRRLQEHNDGKVKATRYVRPWTLVYTRLFEDETSARRREHKLKSVKSRLIGSARSPGLSPEPLGFVGAAGSVAGAVRMSSCAGQPAIVDDQILFPDGTAVEPAFQDLAHTGRVAGLRR